MLLALIVACAPKVAVPPQAPAETPLLLWRVERDGKTSHLLGTCHVGVSLDYALPKPHDAALDEARVVYTEAELELQDPAKAFKLVWTDGPGISQRLPEDRWRAIAVAMRDKVPAPIFEHLEPWALASMLPMLAGGKPATGAMDLEVQQRAKKRGTPVAYVETLDEQATMLRARNEEFLAQLGPTDDDGAAQAEALTALCFRGDTSHADVLLEPDDPASRALLADRNHAWVPKLEPDLAQGGAFVAVGAAHMLGDDGLVALLRKDGFTVTQLTTDRPVSDAKMPPPTVAIPPAPAIPATIEAYEASLTSSLVSGLCAEGQIVRSCFVQDAPTCASRLTEDTHLCVRQYADLFPTDGSPPSAALQRSITQCVPTGVVLDAMAHDRVADTPMCAMLKTAMQGAAPAASPK